MLVLAFQEFSDVYLPPDERHWTDLIAPVTVLLVAVPLLVWLIRYLRRAMAHGRDCLDQSTTAIEVARESIEVTRQAIELQRETNQLLNELIETLKQRPPS
ncbi:MAG: hypothetical protein ACYTGL_22825 [Planctomycetota bacterium]|jgi:hypothetical protein